MTDSARKTKLIAFEGIDGSGKTVQISKWQAFLENAGFRTITKSFPVYESFFGAEIGNLLAGTKPVTAQNLDPKSMCLWYALDRWRVFQSFAYSAYDYVLLNRFSLSNAVYQSIRTLPAERESFISWVFELEEVQLGLPSPDLYVVFDSTPEISAQNISKKGYRNYVGDKPDVYEASAEMMNQVCALYLQIARKLNNIFVVNCVEDGGAMKDPDEIFSEVKKRLEELAIIEN